MVIKFDYQDLEWYLLVRDRAKRTSKPIQRYGHADFIAYALLVSETIDMNKLKTFTEAMSTGHAKH